ncbi:hypothetical protein, partial [Ohtaekwangia sp.]|uniref:hypothetical protein n=1 Tax=Ohtaekwangia sp. TaxID=2066019 RepID=UPI002FDEFF9C
MVLKKYIKNSDLIKFITQLKTNIISITKISILHQNPVTQSISKEAQSFTKKNAVEFDCVDQCNLLEIIFCIPVLCFSVPDSYRDAGNKKATGLVAFAPPAGLEPP